MGDKKYWGMTVPVLLTVVLLSVLFTPAGFPVFSQIRTAIAPFTGGFIKPGDISGTGLGVQSIGGGGIVPGGITQTVAVAGVPTSVTAPSLPKDNTAITLTFQMYDRASVSNAQVYPLWTIFKNGALYQNAQQFNTTTAGINDVLNVYAFSPPPVSSSVAPVAMLAPMLNVPVTGATQVIVLNGVSSPTLTGMNITARDIFGAQLTSFGSQANRSGNYNLSSGGANSNVLFNVYLQDKNTSTQSHFGAICYGYAGNVLYSRPAGSKSFSYGPGSSLTGQLVPAPLPLQLSGLSPTFLNFTGINQSLSWRECYQPSNDVFINAFDNLIVPSIVTSGAIAPKADNGDRVAIGFFDKDWHLDNTNTPALDWYKHDQNQRFGDIGSINETLTMGNQLGINQYIAMVIEIQG